MGIPFNIIYIISELLVITLVSYAIYYLISKFITRISDIKQRYNLKKILAIIILFIDFVIIISIFVNNSSIVALSAGLFSAGIAFSLRDPITSLLAWIIILLMRPVKVGDRIKIGTEEGDIIDITMFFITIMEINDWVEGDLYTGRIVEIPNNQIMSKDVINFSKRFEYIWDNITIPILFESNYKKIANDIKKIAEVKTEKYFKGAEKDYEKLKKEYFISRGDIHPTVFVSFNDNYIKINLRYITNLWERKKTQSEISLGILDYLHKNKIEVASSSIIVSNKK
ncbi:mechanosensitive ion channel family protein [Candidatus Parvarchaeota archaeon]|nr:mechanosensitive ion channel family protein [Candidatus Parvarchaeota archaeon]